MKELGIALCAVLSIFCFGVSVGWRICECRMRVEAIEAGAAHWTIDPTTGIRAFEWKK